MGTLDPPYSTRIMAELPTTGPCITPSSAVLTTVRFLTRTHVCKRRITVLYHLGTVEEQ